MQLLAMHLHHKPPEQTYITNMTEPVEINVNQRLVIEMTGYCVVSNEIS
jgi:hypothetical protein